MEFCIEAEGDYFEQFIKKNYTKRRVIVSYSFFRTQYQMIKTEFYLYFCTGYQIPKIL